ncbi:unnamed protein product [Diamesa tonsa]
MNLIEELGNESCLFCFKKADETRLIEMNNSLLEIGSENIEFSTIIYDVVQRKIISDRINHICDDCNNLIIEFYLFRNNAQSNVNLIDEKVNSGVAKQVQQFLEEIETENITILKTEQVLIISPKEEMINNIKELPFDENLDNIQDEIASEDLNDIEEYEDHQISTLNQGFKPRKKISDLLPNELALRYWCSRQVKSQKTTIQTPQGTQIQWSCSKCNHFSTNRKYFMQHLKRKHSTMTDDDFIKPNKDNEPNLLKTNYTPQQLEMKNWYAQQMKSQVFRIKTENGDIMQWSCSQCSYTTTTCAKTFAKHLKTKHFNGKDSSFKTYSCTKCCINYQTFSQSNAHQKFHEFIDVIASHISYPECKQCRIIFCNINDLNAHLTVHNNPRFSHKPIPSIGFMILMPEDEIEIDEDVAWKCGHCTRKFSDEVECRKHLLIFHARRFVCPIDNREFFRLPTHAFSQHLKKCHPELFPDIPIDCTYCHQVFTTIYDKLAHMKNCDEKKFICQCGNKFFKKAELLKHEKIHTGNTGYNCEICGKMAVNKQSLDTHMLSHTNETPFKCSLCPKAYKTSSARASHMEVHNETDLECSFCSVKFKKRAILQRHIKNYHDEKYREEKFREFTCSFCKKAFLKRKKFFEKHTMTMHLRIHAGSLVYSCEICGKSTANSYDLQNHLRSHTSETPFKCSLCPKAYKTSSARGSHMQTHQEGSHTCPYCGVKFKKREKYKSHIKFFHDEIFRAKRFSELTCSFCNKAFLEKYLYADHMRKAHQVFSGSAAALNKKEGIPSDNDD